MLVKRSFLTKVNTKKKPGYLFISTNRTLHLSLVLSIIFHAGLIYTIPAVDLFSEGLGGTLSDMIVVDFLQEETSEGPSEIPQVIDDQFLAPTPPETETTTQETPSQPLDDLVPNHNDVEITIPRPIDKSIETDTQYTLLANSVARDPEIEHFRKRPEIKQNTPTHLKSLELPKSEKLPVKYERPQPIETKPSLPLQLRTEVNKKPVISKNLQEKDKPEENLNFPVEAYQSEERRFTTSTEDTLEKKFGFGKRPAKEMDRATTFSPSSFEVASQISKRRQFGLSKENEDDKNQFGIFAGEKFEIPQMKETVQEAFAAEGKKEATFSEEKKIAKKLETNDQIEGPVKDRAIVYQPPSPQVDIENEVEFKLKFWVLPDGTIGEVIPLKRGDTNLERVAIAYLKKWQFESLSPDVPQQKIWGTIPIKFTVQ